MSSDPEMQGAPSDYLYAIETNDIHDDGGYTVVKQVNTIEEFVRYVLGHPRSSGSLVVSPGDPIELGDMRFRLRDNRTGRIEKGEREDTAWLILEWCGWWMPVGYPNIERCMYPTLAEAWMAVHNSHSKDSPERDPEADMLGMVDPSYYPSYRVIEIKIPAGAPEEPLRGEDMFHEEDLAELERAHEAVQGGGDDA